MISVLAMCPNPLDGTSYYRGIGPLGRLKQTTGQIELIIAEEIQWTTVAQADVAFLQRPCSAQHSGLAHLVKDWGIPLWVELDDDLFEIGPDNPAYDIYQQMEASRYLLECLRLADHITVSTSALRDKVSRINSRVSIVPNAFDDRMHTYRRDLPRSEPATVLWRGSRTHEKDIRSVEAAIRHAVSGKESLTRWYFQGYRPWFLEDAFQPGQMINNPHISVERYFRFIHDMVRPTVTIVPLSDTPFNRAKSNIGLIESLFAGAPAIVPEWGEWIMPGAITYKTADDFQNSLEWALSNPGSCHAAAREGWAYVWENLRLSKINDLRFGLLRALSGK